LVDVLAAETERFSQEIVSNKDLENASFAEEEESFLLI
jgi:hypothetical protein